MALQNTAFHLGFLNQTRLDAACVSASRYESHAARAITRVLRVVHGLAALHEYANSENLEVYIGRCARSRLHRRFREHRRGGKYMHGAVLFTCATADAARFETIGIAIVQALKDEGILCVNNCNVKPDGYGTQGRDPESVVYIVWAPSQKTYVYEKPNLAAIRRVVEQVHERLGGGMTKRSLIKALAHAKRTADRERLKWAMVA